MSGYEFVYEHANLKAEFLTQNMLRFTWGPGKAPYPYTLSTLEWPELQISLSGDPSDTLSLSGEELKVAVSRTGEVCIHNISDKLIKHDLAPIRNGEQWSISATLAPGECIYGLGERANTLNLRPGTYTSWNTDPGGTYTRGSDPLYIGTPIFLSHSPAGSYLVYFENYFRSSFNIGETLEATFSGGLLRYYVIVGSHDEIYSRLGDLLGRPCLPPRWSLGYHQCRWGYHDEADVSRVIQGFKEHDLPISAIHLDIDYMDQFKVFTVDKSRFPNLKKFTSELDRDGIKVVVSINPAVKRDVDFDIYADGLSKDMYCKLPNGKIMPGVSWPGWSVYPDFTSPHAREWWMGHYQRLVEEGISGVWHDMNEPSSFTAWGDKSFPVTAVHSMEGQGGDHREAHNLYGYLMNQVCSQALQKFVPDKRPWIFSRSGWAGMQKYAWNWTGDIETSWEALQVTIPMMLGLGLSGHVFSGVDIGGFSGSPDAELYIRWFQLGSLLPLFRTHSAVGTEPREPWVFGEPATSIVRKFAKFRYQILPYYYTLAFEAHRTGTPVVRPLFWSDPQNSSVLAVDDEFLLGDGMLVAPIVHAGQNQRVVELPSGVWYHFWDDQLFQGPGRVEISANLDSMPIFIRGGTIFPMNEAGSISFHVFPDQNQQSSSLLYLDSGDGYGPSRMDDIRFNSRSGSYQITWKSDGDYQLPFSQAKWVFHGKTVANASADGHPVTMINNELITPVFRTLEVHLA